MAGSPSDAAVAAASPSGRLDNYVQIHERFLTRVARGFMVEVHARLFAGGIDPSYVGRNGDNILNAAARQTARAISRQDAHGVTREQNATARDVMLISLLHHSNPPFDVHHEGAQGTTPLMAAVLHDDGRLVKLLLKHSRADPARADSCGESPWDCAVAKGRWSIVQDMLTMRGYKPSPLAQERLVHAAAKAGQRDLLRALIAVCCFHNTTWRPAAVKGETLLMAVVRARATPLMVRTVLASGSRLAIDAVICDSDGGSDSALSLAIKAQPRYLTVNYDTESEDDDNDDALVNPGPEHWRRVRERSIAERSEVVRVLLAAAPPPDIELRHAGGNTPLLLAATQGRPDVVEALLEASPPADLNAVNDAGETVLMLMLSATYDQAHCDGPKLISLMSHLIEGARDSTIQLRDCENRTALHHAVTVDMRRVDRRARAAFCRIGRGLVPRLLRAGADANALDNNHDNALMVALQTMSADADPSRIVVMDDAFGYLGWDRPDGAWLAELVTAQSEALWQDNCGARSPMALAAAFQSEALGLMLDAMTETDKQRLAGRGVTRLVTLAAGSLSPGAVAKLLESCPCYDINARDEHGKTALHYAVVGCAIAWNQKLPRTDGEAVLKILLDAGADVNLADDMGRTPLMLAGFCISECLAATLIAVHPRPDPMATDAQGRTAMHYLFLEPCFRDYRSGHPFNHYSKQRDMSATPCRPPTPHRITQLLETADSALINARDCNGRNALLLAASLSHSTWTEDGAEACVQCLMEHKCAADIVDAEGDTAVLAAVRARNPEFVHALVNAAPGQDLKQRDARGNTPLLLAANLTCMACAIELLEGDDAGIEIRDSAGDTALLIAVRKGSHQMVHALLGAEMRANPDVIDAKGRSALLLALAHGHRFIVLALLRAGAMSSLRELAERQTRYGRA